MTSRRHLARLVSLVFTSLWLIACSDAPQDKIIGKWRASSASEGNVLEFYPDGTITFEEAVTGISINGEYAFLNDQKIKIELSGILALAGASIYTISFSDNRMMLEAQNRGGVVTYDKVE